MIFNWYVGKCHPTYQNVKKLYINAETNSINKVLK